MGPVAAGLFGVLVLAATTVGVLAAVLVPMGVWGKGARATRDRRTAAADQARQWAVYGQYPQRVYHSGDERTGFSYRIIANPESPGTVVSYPPRRPPPVAAPMPQTAPASYGTKTAARRPPPTVADPAVAAPSTAAGAEEQQWRPRRTLSKRSAATLHHRRIR